MSGTWQPCLRIESASCTGSDALLKPHFAMGASGFQKSKHPYPGIRVSSPCENDFRTGSPEEECGLSLFRPNELRMQAALRTEKTDTGEVRNPHRYPDAGKRHTRNRPRVYNGNVFVYRVSFGGKMRDQEEHGFRIRERSRIMHRHHICSKFSHHILCISTIFCLHIEEQFSRKPQLFA